MTPIDILFVEDNSADRELALRSLDQYDLSNNIPMDQRRVALRLGRQHHGQAQEILNELGSQEGRSPTQP